MVDLTFNDANSPKVGPYGVFWPTIGLIGPFKPINTIVISKSISY